jgi:transcriptional regulator with PAS, ATPase and Fis domain
MIFVLYQLDRAKTLTHACSASFTKRKPHGEGRQSDMKRTGSCVALVSDDPKMTDQVQSHLRHQVGWPAFECSFDTVRDHLTRETDGLLLLGIVCSSDQSDTRRLVQEISLQKLPVMLVLLDARSEDTRLAMLDPYVSRRLYWPDEAAQLTPLVREFGCGHAFQTTDGVSLEDLLSQRLLALTPSLLPLVDRIALAASHDVTVLLNGETGTGKTYLARLIHEYSPRRPHRFLTVPCGALSANLVESEFFGHVKGAFTGADRPKVGKFAAVGRGTLLLDEIDTLPLEQQATLLRVIETGEFEPVGSVDTQRSDARLIVAANVDLEEAVTRGKFRADLYFRLNVMSFHLPPLRERVMDIAPLARGMAVRFNQKFNKDLFEISPDAMAALEAFHWPGNLRQLENVLQHAVLVSTGQQLQYEHLPAAVREHSVPINGHEETTGESLQHQRDVTERSVIQRALISNGYCRSRAATALGISRVTLYKKMKKYGLMNGWQGL